MRIKGNPKILLVSGDSYTREISFVGIEIELIEGVYFSSEKLSICKKLEFDDDNNVYVLHLAPNETQNFAVGTTTFDLTIQFINDDIKTIQYEAIITILEKSNKVVCYG